MLALDGIRVIDWTIYQAGPGPESSRPAMDPVGIFRTGFGHLGTLPSQEPSYPPGGLADQTNAWSWSYA